MDKLFHNEQLKIILLSNASYYHNDPYALSLFYFAAGQNSYYSDVTENGKAVEVLQVPYSRAIPVP